MSLLNTIKDQVARGISKSYADCKDYISDDPFGASDYAVNQVARRYARSVAEDALKRASEEAKVLVSNGETHLDVKSYTLDDGIRFSPDYNRILSTPINTDL